MRRVRFEVVLLAAALLGGCSLLLGDRAGVDPRGRDLKVRAEQIVAALHHFRADTGRLPAHLFELVPKYLPALPDGLKTTYEPDKDRLSFSYDAHWPNSGITDCSTKIDVVHWACDGYI